MYSSIRDLQMSLADIISSLSENQRNKRTMCQLTFNQQLLNTKLSLAHLKRVVMLLVMGVVTPIVLYRLSRLKSLEVHFSCLRPISAFLLHYQAS
jgi:hypothetical protein